jgi:hypothetical protein
MIIFSEIQIISLKIELSRNFLSSNIVSYINIDMILKVLHILLSIHLLVSSTGLAVYEHICSKNGTSYSLFVKPQSCCSKKKTKSCSAAGCAHHKAGNDVNIKKKPCCEDKTHYKKLNLTATEYSKLILKVTQPEYISFPISGYSAEFDGLSQNSKTLRFYLYKPPPLQVDNLRVLYQSFLC